MPYYDAIRDSYDHPPSSRDVYPNRQSRNPYPELLGRNTRNEDAELFGISAERDRYGYDDPGMFADIERSMRPRERSVQARVNQEAYSGYGRPRGLMDAPPEDGPSSQWRRRRDYMIDPALRSSSGCSHSEPFFLRSEREFPRQIHQSIEQPGYRDAWNSGVSFHPIRRPSPSITSGIRPTLRADRPGIMPRKLRLPGTPMGDPRANVLLGLRAPRYLEGRGTPMPGMGDPYDGRR